MLNLTEAGTQMHTHALEGTLAWLSNLLASLTEEERRQVIQAMELLRPIFAAELPRPSVESEPA